MSDINRPLVSVIVPCYNYGAFLAECLDSVLAQTHTYWECIIVDNASNDNTKDVAAGYCSKDKRFTYLYESQKGVSFARNSGIVASKGKYILPLDADDKIDKNYLKKAVEVLEQNNTLKVVYCEASLFGAVNRKWQLPPFSMKQMLIENVVFCSAVFKRSDFDQTKGYNTEMVVGFEDWDFWLSLIKDEAEVHRIPETLFFYRIRENSRNRSFDTEKQKRIREQIFENHKELYLNTLNISELVFEYNKLKNDCNYISGSWDYKIGKKILAPVRFLKKLMQR